MCLAYNYQFVTETAATGILHVCGGTATTQIAAAFGTEAYWALQDIMYSFGLEDLRNWAPLFYIMAVMSGIMMMALGQPPRLYIWFFIGPAIFDWLLFTTYPAIGVRWVVGGDFTLSQEKVWRFAEEGVRNTRWVSADSLPGATAVYDRPVGPIIVHNNRPPTEDGGGDMNLKLPSFFLWFDGFLSAEISRLSSITGPVFALNTDHADSNLNMEYGGPIDGEATGEGADHSSWSILTNSKWPLLNNITSATLHNQDLREATTFFMASECGEVIADNIDQVAYITSAHGKGQTIPSSIFGIFDQNFRNGPMEDARLHRLLAELKMRAIPVPVPVTEIFKKITTETAQGSFGHYSPFIEFYINRTDQYRLEDTREITCDAYLWWLVQGFRWEAGHVYNQLIRVANDDKIWPETVTYNFLYGWDLKWGGPATEAETGWVDLPFDHGTGDALTLDEQRSFVIDLILLYLFRNEFALAPDPVDPRFSGTEKSINYTEAYQKSLGSKSKYGELYTWAKLMPHIQGVLIYFLTIAYPFACVMLVVPGWHKTFFTWMAFFAWAKSWDLGFAIVNSMERSIWAMIGAGVDKRQFNEIVLSLQNLGVTAVNCPGDELDPIRSTVDNCARPVVVNAIMDTVNNGDGTFTRRVYDAFDQTMYPALRTFDLGLLLAPHLDLDTANAYYIYLMSALYFAVPAVTAQILLGAKAGAASLATNAVGQASGEAGKAAGSGHTGEVSQQGANAMEVVSQGAYAKAMRKGGKNSLASQAMGAGNKASEMKAAAAYQSTRAQLSGLNSEVAGLNQGAVDSFFRPAEALMAPYTNAFQDVGKEGAKKQGRWLKGAFSKKSPTASGTGSGFGSASGTGSGFGSASGVGAGASGGGIFSGGITNGLTRAMGAGGKGGLNGLKSLASTFGTGAPQMAFAMARHGAFNQMAATKADNLSNQGHAAAAQYGLGQMDHGYTRMGQNYNAMAQQRAQEASWNARKKFSGQIMGKAAAVGVFAGAWSAGHKPVQMDGMAGMGMLGAGAQSAFDMFDSNKRDNPNNFFARTGRAHKDLKSHASVGSKYNALNRISQIPKVFTGNISHAHKSESQMDPWANKVQRNL